MKKASKKMLLLISTITMIFTMLSSCDSEYFKKRETNKMITQCEKSINRYDKSQSHDDLAKCVSEIIEVKVTRELTETQSNKLRQLEIRLHELQMKYDKEKQIEVQKRIEKEKQIEAQEKAEEERKMRNLELNPPTSVSDLKKRIEGTVWISEHGINDVLYPKYEFRSGKVSHYTMSAEGGWFFCDSYSYTVKDEGDFYSITFGDGRDLKHLTTSIVFVKSNGAVACFVHETGQRGLLHLENY